MYGELRIVPDVAEAFAGLVRRVRPRVLALSGGDTAERAYRHLATFADLGWARMTVLMSDERWVPVDHPDSNEGMARRVLLDQVGVQDVRSMRQAGADPRQAAAAYDKLLASLPAIDLLHLGMGADGHTASLFPGTEALAEDSALVVANRAPEHPHDRVTFTYPGIRMARVAVITVEGESKRAALRRIRAGEDLPAARIRADEVHWLVAPDALSEGMR